MILTIKILIRLVPIMENNSKSKSLLTKDVQFVSSCLCTLNLFGETKYFLYGNVTINKDTMYSVS